jgi:RNA polymerase sigma factor (TIGR02999 family)
MSELTALFASARAGDEEALGQIFSVLYPDLKAVARARLSRGRRLTMMDTTILVHECFLRFQKLGQVRLEDRHHFLAYAARVIRTVIIDIVRREQAERRGGPASAQTLNTNVIESVASDEADVLAVAEALESLAAADARLASVVEMRYFAGFSEVEIARALGVNERTVRRDWDKARAFLLVALQR